MITFAAGLVLRRGERTLEFERDLGDGRLQFAFGDTREIQTVKLTEIYSAILGGTVSVVRPSQAPLKPDLEENALNLPGQINHRQQALISFRLHYVQAAIRARVPLGSLGQLNELLQRTPRPTSIDESEQALHNAVPTPDASTLRRWLRRYVSVGNSAFSLIDRRAVARRSKRLWKEVERLVEDAIAKHYMKLRGESMKYTHQQACLLVRLANRRDGTDLPQPSRSTVERRIREIDPYVRDLRRFGSGYAKNKWRFSLAGDQSTRILERVEVDHTQLDIWVLDPVSGVPLGRPWITVLIDRLSGYVLAIYISFYGPSAGSVAGALKASILPKADLLESCGISGDWSAMGVAELYVVDNGLEFHSRAFRLMAWALRADLLYNPVRQPWLKPAIERAMAEFNRTLPSRGKVYSPIKNAQAPDPAKSAAIVFDDLVACLVEWAATVFPFHAHPKTLVRPIDLWEEGRKNAPPPILPTSFEHLDVAAGVATERVIGGDGVFFQYLRYNSYELQDYRRTHGERFKADIRFNPDDLGRTFVHLPKWDKWLSVPLQRPGPPYGDGLSLVQHRIIREEAGKKLTRLNADEELFQAQLRLQDRWGEAIGRGLKVKKDAQLIRLQGLTSARLLSTPQDVQPLLPQPSPVVLETLPEVIPFKAFSLSEDD